MIRPCKCFPLCISNIVLIVFLESVRKYTPNVAERCTMQPKDCNAIIGLWTVGSAGECSPKQFGYRIGTKGYKRVVLQVC